MKDIVITIPKEFTVNEASQFREKTLEFLRRGETSFVLDFSQCTFIDSIGLGVLVATYKKCAEINGRFRLQSLNSEVMKVFKLTRLNKVFDIHG